MTNTNIKKLEELIYEINETIANYKNGIVDDHPFDIAKDLQDIREIDFNEYKSICKKIPSELFAQILINMPTYIQEEITSVISEQKVAKVTSNMDSDDASLLIYNISQKDESSAQTVLSKLNIEEQQIIEELNAYEFNEAGAYMQKELFSVNLKENIGDALKRLKEKKDLHLLSNIFHAFLVDDDNSFLGSIGLEELILFERSQKFEEIPADKIEHYSYSDKGDASDIVNMFTNYDLNALAIVDSNNKLLGRVTHNDISTLMQEQDTKQLYSLAGVNDKIEEEESIYKIGKNRAFWLSINLITAILASLVIGIFDTTIQSLVALAVLMPIVASMGGNAGTQTLTVTVRQMALGDIEYDDAKKTIIKEVTISLVNGFLFAVVIGLIAYFWFKIPLLGLVIAISMVINLLSAGFFGAVIPLVLEKFKIDPAIGSTVILTTVTDIVGFFSFLGLATIILL
ncbi:magnesium transporter [Poseidonibacter ostreae]|uniref:CBS domain-containing protein n=1 Tax=Poseidonibacter ostreae TaxID=2654171 RepID=A0A6L4WRZ5_9BACT|nr:magnesium transporter [Poseidonibacter ostreae]KAB7881939.1 CBS domain-containing protein [Poseidonibacter ostreae]KAB7886624.1 CBS domain-containing protein [Poseidonibacter ostreae]KAB7889234.1 CBS domain-containing protein [Poseidonibacter ostreae]